MLLLIIIFLLLFIILAPVIATTAVGATYVAVKFCGYVWDAFAEVVTAVAKKFLELDTKHKYIAAAVGCALTAGTFFYSQGISFILATVFLSIFARTKSL